MIKVLIITDSLGLPRPLPEVVEYEETWVNMLSKNYKVHQISYGGGTIGQLYSQIEYIKMFNPDLVIIQSGIVDCAPRAITKFESDFLNKFRITRFFLKIILKPKTINFLRKNRKCTYTNLFLFENYILKFKKLYGEKLYWIGIVPANEKYENLIPGITENVSKYNDVIKKQLQGNFISLADFTIQNIMSDHIHLSKQGHQLLFDKIIQITSRVKAI